MWYLLVAAGAGYLAQRWQHTHKSRLLPGKCENPTSAPATPKRSPLSLSAVNDSGAASNCSSNKESTSLDSKSSLPCFVIGTAEDKTLYLQLSKPQTDGSPQGISSSSGVLKSNKRTACEAFLVPVPELVKPNQGITKEQIMSYTSPSLDFSNIKENTQNQFLLKSRPSLEIANIQRTIKEKSVLTSKSSVESGNIQGNEEDQLVFTSKSNLDFVNIDNKKQLQGDLTSPSSCCSTSSTVLNSPIGRKPIQQELGPFIFHGKEQRQEINVCKQLSAADSPNLLENNTLKERGQGIVSTASNYDFSKANCTKSLQHTSSLGRKEGLPDSRVVGSRSNINAMTSFNTPLLTDDNGMLDASTQRPHVFTGENQRGVTRTSAFTNENETLAASTNRPYIFTGKAQKCISLTDLFSNEYVCDDKVKLEMKQMTRLPANDTNCPRKVRSLVPPSQNVAMESACDADSETLVSLGLAMAVLCMVSSTKMEMEKMGKVLKETEDLVGDMRKELEERRAQSYVSSRTSKDECNEKLLTIKSKDAVTQGCTIEKGTFYIDTPCPVGLSDDESMRSVVTEEHAQYGLHLCDLQAGHEYKLCLDNGNQIEDGDSEDENDSPTLEETGEDDNVLSMLELERKLWKIFQQRQEEKILELEESLAVALCKLHVKEEELQWWKNRTSWLMEHAYGSTSGVIPPMEDQVESVEGSNHTDGSGFSLNGRDSGPMSLRNFFVVDSKNMCEISACEANFLELEEECIEMVANEDGPKNSSGHQNQLLTRVGSTCSISSENSVLSFDEMTFTYPEYTTVSLHHS